MLTALSILETHDKTVIVLTSFFVTVGGWWAWNGFLSAVYAPGMSPYAVRDGFGSGFGRDPAWWLTLVAALIVLGVTELGYKTVKRQIAVTGSGGEASSCLSWRMFGRQPRDDRRGGVAGSEDVEDTGPPWEWEVGLWQEMEQDPVVQEELKAAIYETAECRQMLD